RHDGVILRDLESANGTFVNGERISARQLFDGDRVRFGDQAFVFEGGELRAFSRNSAAPAEGPDGRRMVVAWITAALAVGILAILAVTMLPRFLATGPGAETDPYSRPGDMATFVDTVEKSVVTVYCQTSELGATGSGFAIKLDGGG